MSVCITRNEHSRSIVNHTIMISPYKCGHTPRTFTAKNGLEISRGQQLGNKEYTSKAKSSNGDITSRHEMAALSKPAFIG